MVGCGLECRPRTDCESCWDVKWKQEHETLPAAGWALMMCLVSHLWIYTSGDGSQTLSLCSLFSFP